MLFNSFDFLVFFPLVCLIYYVIPHRIRHIFLLIASYYFYMCWNPKYALLMLTSTFITYMSGILIEGTDNVTRKKIYVALSFTGNLLILFFFKYYNFAIDILTRGFLKLNIALHVPAFDVILPVGISFYTFQALGYTVDVYRKDIKTERNFLKYALFVSFFPQLVAGPIERSGKLIHQISEKHKFEFERVRSGLILMLYGFFQKIVLAEYLAKSVDQVYDHFSEAGGLLLLIASVLFALQIYCDFGSYSNIAIGAARVMGFDLMENFNTPYFARSVAEFWRRWHISLSTWFRDYLYIPLGGNRKGKIRKWFNLMVVFLCSGLWHGASMHYVVWGGLNGLYQVIGEWLRPVKKKINRLLGINENAVSHKLLQMGITFILVDISWVFFRSESRNQALYILKSIARAGTQKWIGVQALLDGLGLTHKTAVVLLVSILILVIVDICKYNGIKLINWITSQGFWLRWIIYYGLIFGILIFGKYGSGYDAAQFIYFQF